jgi:ABC-2 type transport system ATP-binding protein
MSDVIVSIEDVSKAFADNLALDSISVKIKAGQVTGLVGPDGAGKTTLIRLISGLMHPSKGQINVLGYDSKECAAKIHESLGYMPQKFGLYEDLSVIENMNLYADLRRVEPKVRAQKFKRLLDFTALGPFQKRLASKLSGGMKQKLGLACALIGEPRLLLLDEPSVGVDPISRRELWSMVQELLANQMAVVWSTAYLDEAEKCDSVLLLNQGQKLFYGPPNKLLSKVAGRTWHIEGIAENKRRAVLMDIMSCQGIVDGVIQGKNIRLVTQDKEIPTELNKMPNLHFKAVPPWFEDAFIDCLGGSEGDSVLAKKMPEKPSTDKPVIEALNLTKCFGDFTAVSDNSFRIKQGEIFGLLGPNGAGKSTTFKMLCGLLQPTEGKALVMGLDLKTAASKARSKLGYMAQKFSLYGQLNAKQNLNFFSGLYGLSGSKQKAAVEEMIEIFELQDYLKQNANALPLGFKQRLALACAVMHQPDILFLDEPTSGVDPLTRREFWTHINGMVNKGVTIMVTTHFMDEAEYCDRIALIYKGKNIASGTPDELKDSARSDTLPDPTLEDAFIELVTTSESEVIA